MVKKLLIGFTSVIFSILLFIFISLFVFYQTIFKKVYMEDALLKEGYYDELYHSILDGFSDYAPSLHIEDEETNLDSIIDKEMVMRDVRSILSFVYDGKEVSVDTSDLEGHLDELIDDSLSRHHITPTNEDKKYLKEFKKNIVRVYRDKVFSYVEKYLNGLDKQYNKFKSLLVKGIWGSFLLILVFLFLLILFSKVLKNIFRNVGVSFLTVMFLSFLIYFFLVDKFQHILILSQYFSHLFIYIVDDILFKICLFSSFLGIVGLIFIIIGIGLDYRSKERRG